MILNRLRWLTVWLRVVSTKTKDTNPEHTLSHYGIKMLFGPWGLVAFCGLVICFPRHIICVIDDAVTPLIHLQAVWFTGARSAHRLHVSQFSLFFHALDCMSTLPESGVVSWAAKISSSILTCRIAGRIKPVANPSWQLLSTRMMLQSFICLEHAYFINTISLSKMGCGSSMIASNVILINLNFENSIDILVP
jgi:hypothetical protein